MTEDFLNYGMPFNQSDPLSKESIDSMIKEYEIVSDRLKNFKEHIPESTDKTTFNKLKQDLEEYQAGLKIYIDTYYDDPEDNSNSTNWWKRNDYENVEYWNLRYNGSTTTHDWLKTWPELKDMIEKMAIEGLYDKEENKMISDEY